MSDQATEFWRSGHCEHHRVVSFDVVDIVGYGLKLLLSDWCHRAFKGSKDTMRVRRKAHKNREEAVKDPG